MTKGVVIIYSRGRCKSENCVPLELTRYIFSHPLVSCALKFCPPLTFDLNTLTCNFIRRYFRSICLTHHPKMTFHGRYIDEGYGIALDLPR